MARYRSEDPTEGAGYWDYPWPAWNEFDRALYAAWKFCVARSLRECKSFQDDMDAGLLHTHQSEEVYSFFRDLAPWGPFQPREVQ